MNPPTTSPAAPAIASGPNNAGAGATDRLAGLLAAQARHDGIFALPLAGLHAIRASRPSAELLHGLHRPAICIIARGAKTVLLGEERYDYDAARLLVFSIDLPVAAQVLRATAEDPYLCLRIDIDAARVAQLCLLVYPDGLPVRRTKGGVATGVAVARGAPDRALFLAPATGPIIDAATRLVALAADPDDGPVLAQLAIDEILIRLLRGPAGERLAQIGLAGSNTHRIAGAVDWVRQHYREPMTVEALAHSVHMSPTSFHQHFRAATSMSPLQYQKVLRLQEARRLMLTGALEAGAASRQVGYLSASQFSREYARHFGVPPTRDRLRPRQTHGVDVDGWG
jgi:AraC-like DNA-binding protein